MLGFCDIFLSIIYLLFTLYWNVVESLLCGPTYGSHYVLHPVRLSVRLSVRPSRAFDFLEIGMS